MKSFNMLYSYPLGAGPTDFAYFIDGKSVRASEFHKLTYQAKCQDSFQSDVRNGRAYHRSVVYL